MSKILIALVDDDALIVNLMADFLKNQDHIDILFIAESGEEFLDILSRQDQQPDIVISDLKMDGINGTELTSILKSEYPAISTIIVSSHYKKSFMGFMLKTGVAAFVPKGVSPMQLLDVIKDVSEKGFFFLPDQLETLRDQISYKTPKPVLKESNLISERELDVLKLICQQKTAKEIADKLFIASRTVEGHKNTLFAKTGAKNIAGLVIYAIKNKLININEIPMI